jgi:predicted phage terminase large subunit-like protein
VTPDELLRIVATPTRLGVHLAKDLWGWEAKYDVDPWLAMTEQKVLDAVLDREHQRFVRIHVPPQVGKTSFSGGFLPFWLLGMFPDTRIIFISYSDDYSRLRGGEVRNMIRAYGMELFGIEIDPDREAAGDWGIKGHRGGMLSVGIGSQISGRPGDIIIIDDIIKNMQEAASMATKALHVREYDGTIRGRLQPGGTIIMTSTRWADDDLAGTIGSRTRAPGYRGDQWEVLSFPAIAEPSDEEISQSIDFELWEDELGRKHGEPLACRFTNPDLPWEDTTFYSVRRSLDLFTFSCLFQQNPIASEAGMFPPGKWARYRMEERPKMISEVRVWDPAATAGGGDYSVGVKIGKGTDGRFYVLDVWRDQLDSDRVLESALTIAKADGFMCQIGVEQERAGSGKGTVRFWDVELVKHGFQVFPCPAMGSKEERAKPASTLQHGGRLLIPDDEDNIEWVNVLIDQSRRMMGDGRRGRHDDIVDGMAHGVLKLLDAASVEFWDPGTAEIGSATEREVEGWIMQHLMGVR